MKTRINKKALIAISVIALSVIIDQLLKLYVIKNLYLKSETLINGIVKLTYVENMGGAYGIGSSSLAVIILINVLVIGGLIGIVISKKEKITMPILIFISLVIAGGIGNLIDRIFRGHVIDYIDINPLFKYPVFNVADICVVIGCFAIIFNIIYRSKNETIQSRRKR